MIKHAFYTMQFNSLMLKQESKYSLSVIIIKNQGEAAYGIEERGRSLSASGTFSARRRVRVRSVLVLQYHIT